MCNAAGPLRIVITQFPTTVGDGVDRALVFHPRGRSSLCLPLRYRCDYCHKGFKKSSHLKQHVRSHTGEKPYKCELCGRGFVSSGVLKSHEKTHTGHCLPAQRCCTVCGAHSLFSTQHCWTGRGSFGGS